MRIILPEFIESFIAKWRELDRGRIGGLLTLLQDDDWRINEQVDWAYTSEEKAELGLSPDETVWAVAHSGITIAFVERGDAVLVVYVNRRSAMSPGWS